MAYESFYAVITAAINDILTHGFDSQERLDRWTREIDAAARRSLVPEAVLERSLKDMLVRVYTQQLSARALNRNHPGVDAFTLQNIKPKLRSQLDQRILAASGLIKLNREASVQRTHQRFAAWATSIPIGGSDIAKKDEIKQTVRRSISGLPFIERRVIVDQGHKLAASINEIIAVDGGAIAAIWHHVNEGGGYQARPKHEARDGKIFMVRGNWALKQGLIKLAGHQFSDEITQPGEEVFCRCWFTFVYNLRSLPSQMLTAKGKEALLQARRNIARRT